MILATLWLPTIAAAEDCVACRYFESVRIDNDSKLFSDTMASLKQRSVAGVSLQAGAFCETGPGAPLAADLLAVADSQFERAEKIAVKTNECFEACAPKLNEAEYCGYGDVLVSDRYRLNAVALGLADLAEIYQRASQRAELPIEVLAADMTLYGGEALNVLEGASKALASGDSELVPEVRWQASSLDLSGLFHAVSLLVDFSLIDGDAAQLKMALENASDELSTLRIDLIVALTRAKVMEPSEQLALEERILNSASSLAFVIASLQSSADTQIAAADAALSTDANAVPPGRDPVAVQATVGCLNKLSLSTITGSEAPGMTVDMLNDCRPFKPCSDKDPIPAFTKFLPLQRFLETQDKAEKQTFALIKSMCVAN